MMKRSLAVVLVLLFVLGLAGTAFAAANPFVDVPAKHWAYDAVTKLAQAGILDGYGDGTYRGERLATRYEMAQATAKAMARADKADAQMKGLIDKLAVEFAAELNNLGVRVTKLEKNASSIKFSGDARIRYQTNQALAGTTADSQNSLEERFRLNALANLNDKVSFLGRITYDSARVFATGPDSNDSDTSLAFELAHFDFRHSPTTTFSIGRMAPRINNGFIADVTGKIDGFMVAFGDPLKVQAGYADWGYQSSFGSGTGNDARTAYWLDLTYAPTKDWSLFASTFQSTNVQTYPFSIYSLSTQLQLNKDFQFQASYAWNGAQQAKDLASPDNNTAWAAQLQFRGAQQEKPGTWGLYVNYRDVRPMSLDLGLAGGILGNDVFGGISQAGYDRSSLMGLKGFGFQADYTVVKNVMLTATFLPYSRSSTAADNNGMNSVSPVWNVQANMWF